MFLSLSKRFFKKGSLGFSGEWGARQPLPGNSTPRWFPSAHKIYKIKEAVLAPESEGPKHLP